MNKSSIYQLTHKLAVKNCITHIRECDFDDLHEVIIRPIKQKKTLAQLGGVFGIWSEYLSNEIGESVDYIHRFWKSKFLSRIYVADHLDDESKSYPSEIDSWVELLHIYQEAKLNDQLIMHAKRISLKWATLDQMKRYMNAIESFYQNEDMPLPIIDKLKI